MSRQKFEKTFNTFTKGLMTEASELNFPEDFSLYEKNFLLHRDGGRDRRRGMELMYPLGMTLTSGLYPLETGDKIGVGPLPPDQSFLIQPLDQIGVSFLAPSVTREDSVRYMEYDRYGPEQISVSFEVPAVVREDSVRYRQYSVPPEEIDVSSVPPQIQVRTVAGYLDYYFRPEVLGVYPEPPTIVRR